MTNRASLDYVPVASKSTLSVLAGSYDRRPVGCRPELHEAGADLLRRGEVSFARGPHDEEPVDDLPHPEAAEGDEFQDAFSSWRESLTITFTWPWPWRRLVGQTRQ